MPSSPPPDEPGRSERDLLAAWDPLAAHLTALLREACARESHWRDALRAALSDLLAWMDAARDDARLLVLEPPARGGELDRRRRALMGELATMLDTGREQMERPGDLPAPAAQWIVGGLFDLVYRRLGAADDEQSLLRLLPEMTYMASVAYVGPDLAREELGRDDPGA